TVPPRMGPSIRYHTSSISRNAKPTIAAAASTKRAGTEGRSSVAGAGVALDGGSAARRADRAAAIRATARFNALAVHKVARVPRDSRRKKVVARQPSTAPSVLTP